MSTLHSLLYPCPVCRAAENSLCLTEDHAVRRRPHPRRVLAAFAAEAILGLAHRVPLTQRWNLTRQILQLPDYSGPPTDRAERPYPDPEAARREMAEVSALLRQMAQSLAQDSTGVRAPELIRRLNQARTVSDHLHDTLARVDLGQGEEVDAQTLHHRLLVQRARRVDTDLRIIAHAPPPRGAPEWAVNYRHDGHFRARRVTLAHGADHSDQLTRAWGTAPTPEAAVRAVAHLVGQDDHRVVLSPPQRTMDRPLIAPDPDRIVHDDRTRELLEDDEPAYPAFLEACERVGKELAAEPDLPALLHQRAQALNRDRPQCLPHLLQIDPDEHHPNVDHAHTHVEARSWVPTDRIVATFHTTWGELSEHKAQRPLDIARTLAGAEDAHAFARRLFSEPMRMTRINAWAGPVYLVGEGGDGQHRAHALRLLELPWAAAHITYQVPAPAVDLYGLVAEDEEHLRDTRAPIERARERRRLVCGLIDRGVIDAWWDQDRHDWLWCRSIPAPWLLRDAQSAAAANAVYEATYPGALALLGIPVDVGCQPRAWSRWLSR